MKEGDKLDLKKLGFSTVTLTSLPTPFEEAPRFSSALRGPAIFIKRDDATSLALGGNKARKLELLIGQALEMKCDSVITEGGPQSNHARMTAAAARKYGLEPFLVLEGRDPGTRRGNLLFDRILGANLIFTNDRNLDEVMEETEKVLLQKGRKPYVIPLGGSTPLGTLGCVSSAEEINSQAESMGISPRAVYMAVGSCGTLAGFLLGSVFCNASYRILGVAVSPGAQEKEKRARELALEALGLLTSKGASFPGDVYERVKSYPMRVLDGFVGEGYGVPSEEGLEAIVLLARTEGIITDPVYSGKALAALVKSVRDGEYSRDDAVVFLHTGGAVADFAYEEAFLNFIEKNS